MTMPGFPAATREVPYHEISGAAPPPPVEMREVSVNELIGQEVEGLLLEVLELGDTIRLIGSSVLLASGLLPTTYDLSEMSLPDVDMNVSTDVLQRLRSKVKKGAHVAGASVSLKRISDTDVEIIEINQSGRTISFVSWEQLRDLHRDGITEFYKVRMALADKSIPDTISDDMWEYKGSIEATSDPDRFLRFQADLGSDSAAIILSRRESGLVGTPNSALKELIKNAETTVQDAHNHLVVALNEQGLGYQMRMMFDNLLENNPPHEDLRVEKPLAAWVVRGLLGRYAVSWCEKAIRLIDPTNAWRLESVEPDKDLVDFGKKLREMKTVLDSIPYLAKAGGRSMAEADSEISLGEKISRELKRYYARAASIDLFSATRLMLQEFELAAYIMPSLETLLEYDKPRRSRGTQRFNTRLKQAQSHLMVGSEALQAVPHGPVYETNRITSMNAVLAALLYAADLTEEEKIVEACEQWGMTGALESSYGFSTENFTMDVDSDAVSAEVQRLTTSLEPMQSDV